MASTPLQQTQQLIDNLQAPMEAAGRAINATTIALTGMTASLNETGNAAGKVAREVEKFGKVTDGIDKLKKNVDNVRTAFREAVTPGAAFETAVARMGAATGAEGRQLDALAQKARITARTFGVDAVQATQIYTGLINGLSPALKSAPDDLQDMAHHVLTLSKVMGVDATQATAMLVDGMTQSGVSMEQPAEAARQMEEYINQMVTGCSEQASGLMDTYEERQNRMQAVVNDWKISLFELLSPLGPGIENIGAFVGVLGSIGSVASSVGQVVALVTNKAAIAWATNMARIVLSTVMSARAISTTLFSIPIIGWVALGVTALVALVAYLSNTFAEVRAFLYGMWNLIKTTFLEYYRFIFNVWSAIGDIINPANWFDLDFKTSDVFDKLVTQGLEAVTKVKNAFNEGWNEGMADWEKSHPEEAKKKQEEAKGEPGKEKQEKPENAVLKLTVPQEPANKANPVSEFKKSSLSSAGTGNQNSDGAGARNITMNVTFNNHFGTGSTDKMRQLADTVKRELLAVLTDTVPVVG